MSFTDWEGASRPVSGPVAAVILVHVAIGYALISGLAVRVLHVGPTITRAYDVPEAPPPPPTEMPPPASDAKPQPRAITADPIVRVPLPDIVRVEVAPLRLDPPMVGEVGPVAPPQPPVAPPSLARAPVAIGSRAAWVTEADYPAGALRAGIEGTTGIAVTVGADGRVQGCTVTESSGNAALDDATCRIYARRARFQPGLDDAGHPTTARRSDRVRWQLPRD